MKMKEQAMKELQTLETQHPTRFEYLKHELKAFISLLEEQEAEKQEISRQDQQLHLPILTQESSSSRVRKRKRKKRGLKMEMAEENGGGGGKKKGGLNAAIEKAEACLLKIKKFKEELLLLS